MILSSFSAFFYFVELISLTSEEARIPVTSIFGFERVIFFEHLV